jgi:flagellar basal-body rod protein FlgG
MDSLDMLANNLSNTSTSGFKADREFYSTYIAPELAGQTDTVGATPVVQKPWTDFSQGTLLNTGNATDLGLSGSGFFSVTGPNGSLYTRNGSFHISSQGTLVTAEGYPVRMQDGSALQTDASSPIQVQADGQVSQNGNVIGQLELTEFKDPNQLNKSGAAYFSSSGAAAGAAPAANTQVKQGELETSNAQPAESAARMVSLLRNFEMLQKAVKIGDQMNTQSIEQVAKVGS